LSPRRPSRDQLCALYHIIAKISTVLIKNLPISQRNFAVSNYSIKVYLYGVCYLLESLRRGVSRAACRTRRGLCRLKRLTPLKFRRKINNKRWKRLRRIGGRTSGAHTQPEKTIGTVCSELCRLYLSAIANDPQPVGAQFIAP